jgi:hypothetical protein
MSISGALRPLDDASINGVEGGLTASISSVLGILDNCNQCMALEGAMASISGEHVLVP